MKKAELLRLKNLCVLNSEFCKKPPMMIPLYASIGDLSKNTDFTEKAKKEW